MKIIVVTFSLMFIMASGKSQDAQSIAKKVVDKISSCKTISHFSKQKWGNIGDVNDFTPLAGNCMFKIIPSDTFINSYYCLRATNGHSDIYNGKTLTRVNMGDSTITVTDLIKYPKQTASITSKMLYTQSVVDVYNILAKKGENLDYKMQLLKDTVIDKVVCNRLLLVYSDTLIDNKRSYYHKIVSINRRTSLPVYFKSISQSEYGIQVIESSLSNYKINDFVINSDLNTDIKDVANFKKIKYSEAEIKSKAATLKNGQKAPNWHLPIVQGGSIGLQELKGKVVLLEFSGVYCGFCLVAVKELNKLYDSFDSSKFSLVSVYSDEEKDKLKKYIERYNIKFTVVYNRKEEKEQKILNKYGVSGIPHFFLLDQDGNIAWSSVGYQTNIGEIISTEIKKLLN